MKLRTVKGTADRLPEQAGGWNHVLDTARRILERAGAGELHTPIFEETAVFLKGVGASSDIVRKEMYRFSDRGERDLTLRPEMTAPIMRAYIQHGMGSRPQPVKLWTAGPTFRAENPQRGRERQFHQVGFEIIGNGEAIVDAECIELGYRFLRELGLRNFRVQLGSVGDPADRERYNNYLREQLSPVRGELSADSQERLELNPMRILDAKDANDQRLLLERGIQPMIEFLNPAANEHFASVQTYLRSWEIPFEVDPKIVRGLDYYRRTAFEFIHQSTGMGAQATILAGGRYDGLSEMLGGPPTPGVGWGCGIERVLIALEIEGALLPSGMDPFVYIIPLDDEGIGPAHRVAQRLQGLQGLGGARAAYKVKAVGKALADAEKSGARFAVLIGESERISDNVKVKNLETREQHEVAFVDLETYFTEILKSREPGERALGEQ